MRYEVDNKEIGNIIKKYIRENFDTTDRKVLLNAPDSIYGMSTGAAASIHWSNLNKEFPSNWDKERSIQIALNNIRHFSKDSVVKSETKKVSPMTLLKEKISDYIGDLECIIDDWENYNDYSLYSELQKNDVSASLARGGSQILCTTSIRIGRTGQRQKYRFSRRLFSYVRCEAEALYVLR